MTSIRWIIWQICQNFDLEFKNIIKWLHAKKLDYLSNKQNWFIGNVEKYGDKKKLDYFEKEATKEFYSA
jgi:hypothetical protein